MSVRSSPYTVGLARPTRAAISVTPRRGVPEPRTPRIVAARSTDWIMRFPLENFTSKIGHTAFLSQRRQETPPSPSVASLTGSAAAGLGSVRDRSYYRVEAP